MAPDMEARASAFVGAMKGLSDLLDNQHPELGAPSSSVADLIRMLAAEAERVVPNQGNNLKMGANDDDDD